MENHTVTLRTTAQPITGLLTVNQVAELFGVSRPTIYRLMRRGELRSTRVGQRVRFDPVALNEYLTGNQSS